MAKLLIFRGDTQLQERELTGQTIRIGRGSQNDIVLEDPGKGVSRNHAEIRFEGGRYTLVDLGSQNGIWVAGTRVPTVVLDPDVSAALGPFRLMIEAPVPVTSSGAAAPISGIDTAPIEPTQFVDRAAVGLDLESLGAPPKKQEPATPAAPKRAAPVGKEPTQKERTVKTPRVAPQPASSFDMRIVGGIAALLLIVASAFIAYKMMRKPGPPAWDSSVAQALIASGKCQDALDKQINPALQANPNDQQALALRDQCNRTISEATTTVTSTVPPTPTVDDRLNEAETKLQANVAADCQQGLDAINAVLAEDANNQRAKDLAVKANACINPVKNPAAPAVASADRPAVAVSPAKGGLDVIQGETEKAYKARMDAARKKYEDAVAVLNSQKYVQAMAAFNELINEVPSGYLDLQQRRDEARTGMRAEAKTAMEAAQAADGRDNFDAAIDGYRRARQLDSSLQVDGLIQKVNERKLALGRQKCTAGTTDFAIGNTAAALAELREAVRLLPQSDPCYTKATEALQKLQK